MECESFNELLMDLVYDELDELRSAAMRRHLEGCVECARAHVSVTQGRSFGAKLEVLSAPELSPEVRSLVLVLTGPSELTAPPLRVVAPRIERVVPSAPRWLHTLGEIAMRRQVAMAAVFLVMVGFGLRYVRHSATPVSALTDTSEAGGSPMVIPATELTRSGAVAESPPPPSPVFPRNGSPHSPPGRPTQPLHRSVNNPVNPSLHALPLPSVVNRQPVPEVPPALQNSPDPTQEIQQALGSNRDNSPNTRGNRSSLDALLPRPPDTQNFRGSNGVTAAENHADDFRSQGQRSQEINELRTGLNSATDDVARRQLTLRLITALDNAGRHDEASTLRSGMRVQLPNSADMANRLPPSPGPTAPNSAPSSAPDSALNSVPTSSNSLPHSSVVRPSQARPVRRSVESNAPSQAYGF